MVPIAVLLVAAGGVGPGPVVSSDWARCEGGGFADLRPDIPLIVVSEAMGEVGWEPAFATEFVLYADGALIARRRFALVEWRLNAAQVAELWERIGADQLLALEPSYDLRSERERETKVFHHSLAPTTEVHLWKDGCLKRIVVQGLSPLAAASALGQPRFRGIHRDVVDRHGRALAALPPALNRALRTMLLHRPPGGRPWCRGASCFDRARELRHRELWDGPPDPLME
jgi:hypothetical protein